MPNQISPEKAKAIAQEYCNNGFKKGLAMAAVGYADSCTKAGDRIADTFDNVLVKAEIKAIQAKTSEISQKKAIDIVNDIADTHRRAKLKDDFTAELRAEELLGKHQGIFERDNLQKQQGIVIMIAPPAGPQQADTGLIDSKEVDNG